MVVREMSKKMSLSRLMILGIISLFIGISFFPVISGDIGTVDSIEVSKEDTTKVVASDSISAPSSTDDSSVVTKKVIDESLKITPDDTSSDDPSGSISTDDENILDQIDDLELLVRDELRIRLKTGEFDPLNLLEEAEIEEGLMINDPNNCYYLLQFIEGIKSAWINEFKRMGVEFIEYIPECAYLVHMNPDVKKEVEVKSYVRWIGTYHTKYRLDPSLDGIKRESSVDLRVVFSNVNDEYNDFINYIEGIGGKIIDGGSGEMDKYFLSIKVPESEIETIASLDGVTYVQPEGEKITCMNNVREFTGANLAHIEGFDGSGILGMVKDNGFDQDHPDIKDNIIYTDGNPPLAAHGTCTAGIIFSTGESDEQAKGILPNGQGIFCYWAISRITSMNHLVNQWSEEGHFLSNPWVSGDPNPNGVYNAISEENDLSVLLYDRVMLYPTGNRGHRGEGSLYPDSVSKNVITIGAVNHFNDADRTNDEWGSYEGDIGYSGIGPTADGRIKPDLCGGINENVYTVDNRDGIGEDGYRTGNYVTVNTDAYFGGTSAATSVVAGATGLVYEMYIEDHFDNNPGGEIPHASTVKALLINGAYQYDLETQATRFQQGWGLADVGNTYEIGNQHYIVNEDFALEEGLCFNDEITPDENSPLKITLVWTDPEGSPGSEVALVNNLNLKVTPPDGGDPGTFYWGNYGLEDSQWSMLGGEPDILNNVENVFVENPKPGIWLIEVKAENIVQDGHDETPGIIDQDFALIATTIKLICGDINNDGTGPDITDLVYLVDYMFQEGPEPPVKCLANVDGQGGETIDIADLVYLVDYMFTGGPAPDNCC